MHPIPIRLALVSSVLMMGSVGTVSAVSLQSAPAPLARVPGTPQALAPHRVGLAPRLPDAAPPTPTDLGSTAPAAALPPASRPGPVLDARGLVNLATSPLRKGAVKVPVSGLNRPVRRVVTHVTAPRPVKRAKSIGPRFGAEMARWYGGEMGWRAFAGYPGAARGYPGMGYGWVDGYVGRHRAE